MGSSTKDVERKMREQLEAHRKARAESAAAEAQATATAAATTPVRGMRSPSPVSVKGSDDPDSMRKDYEQFAKSKNYSTKDWWKNAEKDMVENPNRFYFESQEDAGAFFLAQALKGQKFDVFDTDGNLLLRSDGRKLSFPDGRDYTGGSFLPEKMAPSLTIPPTTPGAGAAAKVDKTGVDKTGVDETGVDETGVDETGVDERGVDERDRSGFSPP